MNSTISAECVMESTKVSSKPMKSFTHSNEVRLVIPEQQETIHDYPMPFSKLVSNYAKNFPFQVDISESLYGVCGGGSLFHGEQLCLHFLKETDALIAKSGYEMYYVPVCTSYQCNIGVCKDEPLAPTDFSSMVRFLSSSALPKVVCVEDGAEPVKTGELLLVKELNHSHKKDKVNFITCWSITEQKEKCLNKLCKAFFNIASEATKVYLRDVIDHCQLPMTVKLYTTGTSTTTLTINERSLVKSVVVSNRKKPNELFDIVASIDMMAKKLKISASDTKELKKRTALVYEAFHPSQITMVISGAKASYSQSRARICTSVLDDWKNYIKLVPLSILPEKKSPKPHAPIVPPKPRKVCPVGTMTCDDTQLKNITTSHDDTYVITKPVIYDDPQLFPVVASTNTSEPIHYETIPNDHTISSTSTSIEQLDCHANVSYLARESKFITTGKMKYLWQYISSKESCKTVTTCKLETRHFLFIL